MYCVPISTRFCVLGSLGIIFNSLLHYSGVFSEIYWLPSAETLVTHFYIFVIVNSMLAKIFLTSVISMAA